MWARKTQISQKKYTEEVYNVALLALIAEGPEFCDHTAHSPLAQ